MYVSAKIAIATVRTVLAMRSGITWGSTCLRIRRMLPAPSARARCDVGPLAHALRLGADEPRRARPVDDPDDEDDVGQAAAEERGDDDHQGDVGDHEHVVGDAHEHGVAFAAVETRPEPDRPADEHGDERRGEADDERDARAGDDEREHVRPAVVRAQPVGARRRLVDGAGLRPWVVRLEERREDRDEDEDDEDGEAEDHRRLPEHRGAEEAEWPPRRDAGDVGDRGLFVERGRRSDGTLTSRLHDPRVELHVEEVGDQVEEDHRERRGGGRSPGGAGQSRWSIASTVSSPRPG